jgi:1,2-diacylglycerol 3-beta-galactosyltransferase
MVTMQDAHTPPRLETRHLRLVPLDGRPSPQFHAAPPAYTRLPAQQLLLFTGHNAALADRLKALRRAAPQAVVGFTPQVPRLLRLADVFVGKPGPGALSEALQLGLPVITFDNAWTMPQERFNTRWVRDLGVGRVLRSLADLPDAVEDVCLRLDDYRARVQWLDNRAIHEVPQVLDELLRGAPQTRAAPVAAAPTELSLHEVSA